jgi:hypothetical protein
MLDPGTFTVDFSDERLTVVSNRAPRLSVIKRVALAAGFELLTGDIEPQNLTVRIENSQITKALSELLTDLPYGVEYDFDADRKVHFLARLRVGNTVGSTEDRDVEAIAHYKVETHHDETEIGSRFAADEDGQERPPIDHEIFEDLQREVEDLVIEQFDLFDRAASSTSQIRSEAIKEFTLAGEGLDVVLESLAFDPDPEVRTAAAQRLAEVKGFATIIGLVQALDDPSSEVAQQAIRSLVAIGDRSVVPYMQHALEQQSDPSFQQTIEAGIQAIRYRDRMDSDGIEIDSESLNTFKGLAAQ